MLPAPIWKTEAVVRLFMLVFIGLCFGVLAMNVAAPRLGASLHLDKGFVQHLFSILFIQGLGLVWVKFFLVEHGSTWKQAFGLGRQPGRSLATGLAVILLALPAALIVLGGTVQLLLKKLGYEAGVQPTITLIKSHPSAGELVVLAIAAVFIAPIGEEVLFRGVLYPALKQRWHPRLAFWGTAALFGAIHFNVAAFVPLMFLGLVFAWLYERTGNLLAPVAAHCVFNGINFLMLVNPPKFLEKWGAV